MTNHNNSNNNNNNTNNNNTNYTQRKQKLNTIPSHHVTSSFLSDVSSFHDVDQPHAKTYRFLLSRIYLLSSLIGDRQPPYNTLKGLIGRILWITNLIIHFSFDFYEVATAFHYSWASSVGVFFVMFVICTVFFVRHTVRWFTKTLKKLCKEKIYADTLQWIFLFFKLSPYIMAILSVVGAAGQYGCYAYDDALTLKFASEENGTSAKLIPYQIKVILNIVRFTSLMHIYYMMFLLLTFTIVIFFMIAYSQKAFNNHMASELKACPPSMTFQQAVDQFSQRTKLLRGASKYTTVIFTTVLVATSLSFVVNAYNFLFIKRYAIYIWFTIAPLMWTVSILVGAAHVTSSFQKLKFIVIQAWVEIPEKYDEIWSRAQSSSRPPVRLKKGIDWKAGLENIRRQKEVQKQNHQQQQQQHCAEPIKSPDDCHVIKMCDDTENQTSSVSHGVDSEKTKSLWDINSSQKSTLSLTQRIFRKSSSTEIPKVIIHPVNNYDRKDVFVRDPDIDSITTQKSTGDIKNTTSFMTEDQHLNKYHSSRRSESLSIPKQAYNPNPIANEELGFWNTESLESDFENKDGTVASNWKQTLEISDEKSTTFNSVTTDDTDAKTDGNRADGKRNSLYNIVRVARNVNRCRERTRKKKFNYEKYIKFLELTLDTIGFSLGKMTITWDRVLFFIGLLLTLVGAFAQNAFLKGVR